MGVPCLYPSRFLNCLIQQSFASSRGSVRPVAPSQNLFPCRTWIGLASCCNSFSASAPAISSFVPALHCHASPDSLCSGTFGTCSCDRGGEMGEGRRGPRGTVTTQNRSEPGLFSSSPAPRSPRCTMASRTGNLLLWVCPPLLLPLWLAFPEALRPILGFPPFLTFRKTSARHSMSQADLDGRGCSTSRRRPRALLVEFSPTATAPRVLFD